MKWRDQWTYVKDNMKKNKLRVFMTVLATAIGTAFLILLASVAFGFEKIAEDEILSDGTITQVEVYSDEGKKLDVSLREREEMYALTSRTHIGIPTEMKVEDRVIDPEFLLLEMEEEKKVDFPLEEGRLPEKANEVVVGANFVELLHEVTRDQEDNIVVNKQYTKPVIGTEISLYLKDGEEDEIIGNDMPLKVVGIKKAPAREWEKDQTIYGDASLKAVMEKQLEPLIAKQPANEQELMRKNAFYTSYHAHAETVEKVPALKEMLQEEGYMTYSVLDNLSELQTFFLVLKVGVVFVGTIAVFIASIGIFNTMTMAVTERTPEIGQMKALGASPRLVRRLFLMESAAIGMIGTAVAVAISYIISIGINFALPFILKIALSEDGSALERFQYEFSYIPLELVVIASVISFFVALLSGWRPAKKATNIQIIDALRMNG